MSAQSTRVAKKSLALTRLSGEKLIKVDGNLMDPAWGSAATLGPLTQVDPVEGAKPTRSTRIRVCFDRDFIYFAIECTEKRDLIRARIMERDARLDPDDRIELWIDTFHDQRFAYWFQIGAGGSKGDGLISDGGSRFNKSWDGIWYGRTRVSEHGWRAEIAIPFKTMAFRHGSGTWGFNVRRLRKENNEETRWASPHVAYQFFRVTEGGTLTGLEGVRHGIGLDVTPYAKFSMKENHAERRGQTLLGDFGIDASFRITPSLNLRLTANTDFAETEVDERRNNLTRFPLFFPEKRDFFLEDQGLFDFGPSERSRRTLLPFFSRRIGRDEDGAPVDLEVGAKLTGRVGNWNVGMLGVSQGQHTFEATRVEQKEMGVARASYNLGGDNSVGVIGTWGRPEENGEAYTAGADFRWGDSRLFGNGNDVNVWGYWLMTRRDGGQDSDGNDGDGVAFGVQAQLDGATWNHLAKVSVTGTDFSPELGFVRRTGIHEYRWCTRYTWRNREDGLIKRFVSRLTPTFTTRTNGKQDEWQIRMRWFELTLWTDDRIEFETIRRFERLREDFEIREDEVTVPDGRYDTLRQRAAFRSAERRNFSVNASVEWGSFLSGSLTSFRIQPRIFLSRFVQLSGSYREDHANLRQGDFIDRISEGRVDFVFSPVTSLRNIAQYDTDSNELGLQSRFRWILRPGQELFLVGLYGWMKEHHTAPLRPTAQETTLKVLFTVRF